MQFKITRHQRAIAQTAPDTPAVVMVIDDDHDITCAVAALLSTAGYNAVRCHTRQEALESVRGNTPDMVIADVNLAGYSGLELCHELQREAGMSDVPWMFLSGAQIPDIIRRAHHCGGAYHLRKPFDPKVLVELVHKAVWLPQTAYAGG